MSSQVYVQALSALMVLAGLVGTAIAVVAAYIKTAKEQSKAQNDNWASAVEALEAHNDALKVLLEDMEGRQQRKEAELADVKQVILARDGEIKRFEVAERTWTRRNEQLYEHCIRCRDMLAKHGIMIDMPNGGAD